MGAQLVLVSLKTKANQPVRTPQGIHVPMMAVGASLRKVSSRLNVRLVFNCEIIQNIKGILQ